MNRSVLASINDICAELETLGMHKEASEMTNVMAKIAAKIEIFEAAKVRTLGEKIIVEFTNDYWHYRRSQRNFETIEDAKKCTELWDLNNGVTLCEECHKLTKYGRNNYGR